MRHVAQIGEYLAFPVKKPERIEKAKRLSEVSPSFDTVSLILSQQRCVPQTGDAFRAVDSLARKEHLITHLRPSCRSLRMLQYRQIDPAVPSATNQST